MHQTPLNPQSNTPEASNTLRVPLSPPPLYEYQVTGSRWLSERRHGLLADKQRLGKTVQAIRACDLVQARRILVVCRAVARENWKREFERFSNTPRPNYVVVESGRDIDAHFALDETPLEDLVVVSSYESVGRLLGNLHLFPNSVPNVSAPKPFDVVIVDESHYLKSVEAKRTKEILGVNGLIRRSKRTWLLTGTPTPNHAGELWTTLYTFGATKLNYFDFVMKFCETRPSGFGTDGFQILGTKTDKPTLGELRDVMKKCVLRRTEEDVDIDLPRLNFDTVVLEPGPVELAEHEEFIPYILPVDRTKELQQELQNEMGILNAIVNGKYASDELMSALKARAKSISNLRRFTGLQKMEGACELIKEELRSGAYQKCVIFGLHVSLLTGVQHRLQEFNPVLIYGGTRPSRRDKFIRWFQDPKNPCRVIIGNIAAAGTSISLTAANHIFFLEESWTPGDNAQAAMRCGGVNQKKPIFVRTFALNNSVDQKVSEILRRKMEEQALIYKDFNTNDPMKELL